MFETNFERSFFFVIAIFVVCVLIYLLVKSIDPLHKKKHHTIELVEIIPGLYLGNRYSVEYAQRTLPDLRAVLNVAIEIQDSIWRSDVSYLHLPINETSMDSDVYCKYLNQGLDFINLHLKTLKVSNNQQGAVLVHCAAGINRSATFVIAYLMSTYNWSWEFARNYVKERKPNINPSSYLQSETLSCFSKSM